MRLYFTDTKDNQKHYLHYEAENKQELKNLIGGANFSYNGENYPVSEVRAESNTSTVIPALFGGFLGIIGGGVGVAIGAAIGAMAGESLASTENKKVKNFNDSTISD